MLSVKQIRYASALFIIASSLLIKSVYVFTLQDSWISVILAVLVSLVLVSAYGALETRHPGLDHVGLCEAVFGKGLGKFMGALYVFFFLSLAILNLEDTGSFVNTSILPQTPVTIVYVCMVLVCALSVSKGPKICLYSTMMVIIIGAILVLNMILLLNKADMEHFLPILAQPPKNYALAVHALLMLPLGEIFAFLTFSPHMKKPEEMGAGLRGGILVGGFMLFIIVVRDIAAMGGYLQYVNNPTFSSVRLIEVGDILTRLEILYASILITAFTFKISVCYYAAITGLARLLKIDNYRIFIGIFGVLIVVATRGIFQSTFEHNEWKRSAPVYSTVFLVLLPLLMLLVSFIRFGRHPKKPTAAADGGNQNNQDNQNGEEGPGLLQNLAPGES